MCARCCVRVCVQRAREGAKKEEVREKEGRCEWTDLALLAEEKNHLVDRKDRVCTPYDGPRRIVSVGKAKRAQ